jgi:hypothetical protein
MNYRITYFQPYYLLEERKSWWIFYWYDTIEYSTDLDELENSLMELEKRNKE